MIIEDLKIPGEMPEAEVLKGALKPFNGSGIDAYCRLKTGGPQAAEWLKDNCPMAWAVHILTAFHGVNAVQVHALVDQGDFDGAKEVWTANERLRVAFESWTLNPLVKSTLEEERLRYVTYCTEFHGEEYAQAYERIIGSKP